MSAHGPKPRRHARTRLTKPEKYLLRARIERIPEYEMMAKQYAEGRKTRTKPNEKEIRWRKAQRAHTKGIILGTITNNENQRLNRFKEVAQAIKQLKPDQPRWKKRAKAFSLLFDYMLPHIRSNIHEMPRLREIITERERLNEIIEKHTAQQPVSVGDLRRILTYAGKEYLYQLKELSHSEYTPSMRFTIREAARTQQEEILHIQNQLGKRLTNSTISAREQEKIGLRKEWFDLAMQYQLRSFTQLLGGDETKHVSGAEWVLQNWMRTQNNLKPESNDPQGRDEWENPR
ncbi:MAG: hypothetical protein FJY86_02415 [Candidatus Diapherotrites archaeon]|uniref:Uncharacterized protein n=1 Tax=Candidatus Iainarchaeum sp. TaxID=3101447 RepID=A0A8T4C6X8_9ARCH|nr:hypothetical protein [Candidatus Diapherotrites archaeon]